MAARLGKVLYVICLIVAGLWVLGVGGHYVSQVIERPLPTENLMGGMAFLAGVTFVPAGIIWGIGWAIRYVLAGGDDDEG